MLRDSLVCQKQMFFLHIGPTLDLPLSTHSDLCNIATDVLLLCRISWRKHRQSLRHVVSANLDLDPETNPPEE